MIAEAELAEYGDEIRREVCSRCIERPPGGPPCGPLGKICGVELHLPQLVDSIRQVHSLMATPYLERNRQVICGHCDFLHSSFCPCPMDYLAVLIVEAVEAVDERRGQRLQEQREAAAAADIDIEQIRRAYREGTGTWTGCDWTTFVGKTGLDLRGCTAAEAQAMARRTADPQTAADWQYAATWVSRVEEHARKAELHAAEAVHAAERGDWHAALQEAERAWALEFATGRPLRHGFPLTWQDLREVLERAYVAQGRPESPEPALGGVS